MKEPYESIRCHRAIKELICNNAIKRKKWCDTNALVAHPDIALNTRDTDRGVTIQCVRSSFAASSVNISWSRSVTTLATRFQKAAR